MNPPRLLTTAEASPTACLRFHPTFAIATDPKVDDSLAPDDPRHFVRFSPRGSGCSMAIGFVIVLRVVRGLGLRDIPKWRERSRFRLPPKRAGFAHDRGGLGLV